MVFDIFLWICIGIPLFIIGFGILIGITILIEAIVFEIRYWIRRKMKK